MSLQVTLFIEFVGIFILLGWGIQSVYRVGQFNNAPIFLMGVGAYFTAWALRDLGWSFILVFPLAVALGTGIAFVFALPLGRASGFTMAIATVAPIVIFQGVVKNQDFLGGVSGLSGIPRVGYLLPLTIGTLLGAGMILYRIERSYVGRAMSLVFAEPAVADSVGVDRRALSVSLQTLAGAFGAAAGAIYAPLIQSITVANFGFTLLILIYAFVFIGGYQTMWGVVIATPILWGIRLVLPRPMTNLTILLYGIVLVAVLVWRPEGVVQRRTVETLRSHLRIRRTFRST